MSRRLPLSREFLEQVAAVFRVLGDPTRLEILQAVMSGPLNVSSVVLRTGKNQANVSKHLAVLAAARLVKRTRRGTQIIYHVNDPIVGRLCDTVCASVQRRMAQQVRVYARRATATR